jgi:hypothetical protein
MLTRRKVLLLLLLLGGCVRMGHGIFGDCADCEPIDPAAAAAIGVLLHQPPYPVYQPMPVTPLQGGVIIVH